MDISSYNPPAGVAQRLWSHFTKASAPTNTQQDYAAGEGNKPFKIAPDDKGPNVTLADVHRTTRIDSEVGPKGDSAFLFGTPVEPTLIPRIIMVLSMVTGVLTSAAVFVVGMSVTGWAIGAAVDTVQAQAAEQGATIGETAEEHVKS